MEWLTKICASLEYIEAHFGDEISCETAANIACCAVYYFQRMFFMMPACEPARGMWKSGLRWERNKGCKLLKEGEIDNVGHRGGESG